MCCKVLVANGGEMAVRAFRAAYELGAQTVAVFRWEYRNSVHRLKADGGTRSARSGTRSRPPCTLVWRPPHVVPFVRGS